MADYGVLETGFNRKRLDEIVTDLNAEFRLIFGDDMNLDAESPDGQIIGIFAKALADLYEAAEGAYNAASPVTATGVALSRLSILGGITRKSATASTVELTLGGTAGTVIAAGSQVGTADGVLLTLLAEATVGATGTVEATGTAEETGPLLFAAGTVTEIETPITGWDTVSNAAASVLGTDEETDSELRARFIATRSTAGAGTIDAIYAAVANIDGVTLVTVTENRSDTANTVSGLPGHSFRVVVVGGDDDEISAAIWANKPAGIASDGNTYNPVVDSQGKTQSIFFSRPTSVGVAVTIGVGIVSDTSGDGTNTNVVADIQDAIVAWVASTIQVGEDVIASRLYTPVNEVALQYDVFDLRISRLDDPLVFPVTISISDEELASFDASDITVLVV